jgi:hypothetical protein
MLERSGKKPKKSGLFAKADPQTEILQYGRPLVLPVTFVCSVVRKDRNLKPWAAAAEDSWFSVSFSSLSVR